MAGKPSPKDTVLVPDKPIVPVLPDSLECDVVVIGGGPNGLMTAAYLARAGLKVILCERRYEIGGGLATEEILFPSFYANTHATYHMMVDYMPVFADFDIRSLGLIWVNPNAQTGMIFRDGRGVLLHRMLGDSVDSLRTLSDRDAEAFEKTYRSYEKIVDQILAPATYWPPSPPAEFAASLEKTAVGKELARLSEMSPIEIIDETATDPRVKAILTYMSCMWGIDPNDAGMGFMVPLLLVRGLNKCLCYGGSHKFAGTLAKELVLNGGLILENAEVTAIVTENGTIGGVETRDGRRIRSKAVASSLDPRSTFLTLVGKDSLPEDIASMVDKWQWDKWSLLTVHLALNEPPRYTANDRAFNGSFINILGFDSQDDVIKFFSSVRRGDISPIGGHVTCETLFDPTLSRVPGKHTAFFQMPAPYDLTGGWQARKDELVRAALDLWRSYAPNMTPENILMTVTETPLDIERRNASMIRGSIKHGDYNPLQMGYFRPNDLCSASRTPLSGLYLCGASMYPGGLIIGGPGYIAANTIAEDMNVKKWWRVPDKIKKYIDTYL